MQLLRAVSTTMSYDGSPYSAPEDEYDFEDDGYDDLDEFRDPDDTLPSMNEDYSDEDTEEASETDLPNDEPHGFNEQIYVDRLCMARAQLEQLEQGVHPILVRRVAKLRQQLHERRRINTIHREHMYDIVEREYIAEKKAAAKEFEEKKVELRENLLNDFEDKRKMIENERHSLELNGDSMEVKPVMKRILRRRANEPPPPPAARRKPLGTALVFELEDRDVEADLRAIANNSISTIHTTSSSSSGHSEPRLNSHNLPLQPRKHNNSRTCESPHRDNGESGEPRVEDGKLWFERRWFHRGQSVYVEGREIAKFSGHIHAITDEVIWVKKLNLERIRIYISQLARGKVTIKRRAN